MQKYSVGSIVELKKSHPSKTLNWKIESIGIDVKLRSTMDNKLTITIPRITFDRSIKKIDTEDTDAN